MCAVQCTSDGDIDSASACKLYSLKSVGKGCSYKELSATTSTVQVHGPISDDVKTNMLHFVCRAVILCHSVQTEAIFCILALSSLAASSSLLEP